MVELTQSTRLMNGDEPLTTLSAGTRLYFLEQRDQWALAKDPDSDLKGWINIRAKAYREIGTSQSEQERLKAGYRDWNRADALEEENKLAESAELRRRCLAIEREIFGDEHPDIAQSTLRISRAMITLERYDEAEKGLREGLSICEKYLGEGHMRTASTLFSLGELSHLRGKLDDAKAYYNRAVDGFKTEDEPVNMDVANTISQLGLVHYDAAEFQQAVLQFRQALEMYRTLLGDKEEQTATTWGNCGDSLYSMGKFNEALACYEQALSIRIELHGEGHDQVAYLLTSCGNSAISVDDFDKAESYYERSLKAHLKAFGEDDYNTAVALQNCGILKARREEFQDAIEFYQRSAKAFAAADASNSPGFANLLFDWASVRYEIDDIKGSKEMFLETLAILEASPNPDQYLIGATLNWLGSVASDTQEDADDVKDYHLRALEVFTKSLGEESVPVATTLRKLGEVAWRVDDLVAAKQYLDRSLATLERLGDVNRSEVANTLTMLGHITHYAGDLVAARAHLDRALALRTEVYGEQSSYVADSISNLGDLEHTLGNYDKSMALFQQALQIHKKIYGNKGTYVAQTLGYIAMVLRDQERYEQALEVNEQALRSIRDLLGEKHVNVARRYSMASDIHHRMGELQQAEEAAQKALETFRHTYSESNLEIVNVQETLALIQRDRGELDRARSGFLNALKIRKQVLPADHGTISWVYIQLAELETQARQPEQAGQYFEFARRIARMRLARVLPTMSAVEQVRYIKTTEAESFDKCLTFAIQHADIERVKLLSLGWLINGKGIGQEALAESALLSRPETIDDVRRLRVVRAMLSRLGSRLDSTDDEQTRREKIAVLETEQLDLQRKIAAAGTGMSNADPWISAGQLRDSLPPGSVMIQIARIEPYDFNGLPDRKAGASSASRFGESIYVAWLIPATGEGDVNVVPLGTAKAIDQLVDSTVREMKKVPVQPSREQEQEATRGIRSTLQSLASELLKPLYPHIQSAKQWIICPDGALWLVPWGALPVGQDYVIDRYDLRYVVSGRELVATRRSATGVSEPVVVADPDYDINLRELIDRPRPSTKEPTPYNTLAMRSADVIGPVERLPGTAVEAKLIAPELEKVTRRQPKVLLRSDATESQIKSLYRPEILVLSTHGFLFEDQQLSEEADDRDSESSKTEALRSRDGSLVANPLLRCGLLLAGCNQRDKLDDSVSDDGVLTGLEVVGIDLRGTELVVLSACDTGRGSVQCGEGIAGLRQAFQFAGADAVAATLWTIPDDQTVMLMQAFFQNLADGKDHVKALCDAQRQIIQHRRSVSGVAHPFFWAAFTLTGR
ncbi:MAG: CHAT domain-containing tetratricopeptide repeat protein [Pirellulaceae bacterium]